METRQFHSPSVSVMLPFKSCFICYLAIVIDAVVDFMRSYHTSKRERVGVGRICPKRTLIFSLLGQQA